MRQRLKTIFIEAENLVLIKKIITGKQIAFAIKCLSEKVRGILRYPVRRKFRTAGTSHFHDICNKTRFVFVRLKG